MTTEELGVGMSVFFTTAGAVIPGPETNTLCDNATDDDGDTKINDGCGLADTEAEADRCDDDLDDDRFDDWAGGVTRKVNDGCPQVGAQPEHGNKCRNSLDDDGDTKVNDGCYPGGFGGVEAEVGSWCDNSIDDDPRDDAAGGAQKVNDGCPQVGADGDGWNLGQEALIGTDPNDPCGNDGWPADLDPNNILSIGDINSFTTPSGPDDGHGTFNYFNHSVPDVDINGPPDDSRPNAERWDLDPGNDVISIGDINALTAGPTGYPPMFGGEQAFGQECPWPP
jgi:hypothetical protein